MRVNPKGVEIVSEPYYRGAGLIGNAIVFALCTLVAHLIWPPIDWGDVVHPLITVLVLLLTTRSAYVPNIRRNR